MDRITLTSSQAKLLFAEVNSLIAEANNTVVRLQKMAVLLAAATQPLCMRPADRTKLAAKTVLCPSCEASYPAVMVAGGPINCAVCHAVITRG